VTAKEIEAIASGFAPAVRDFIARALERRDRDLARHASVISDLVARVEKLERDGAPGERP